MRTRRSGGQEPDAESLDLIEIAAELVKEFGVKPWEIPELDRWTIAFVYFAPRGKYGDLIVRPKSRAEGPRLSERDAWILKAMQNWGFPHWYAERRWQAIMTERRKGV